MIRLRPSELTLTPDDVEQTFRRIVQRQTSTASMVAPSRASAHPGRPLLRRGPQRSTRDAITIPCNIPILRPQSQQAVYASLDDDLDDSPDPLASRRDSATGPSPPVHAQSSTASPALRALDLAFRLRRDRHSSRDEQLTEVNSQPLSEFRPAAVNQMETTAVDSTTRSLLQSPSMTASDTHAELRGGGRRAKEDAKASPQETPESRSPSPPPPQAQLAPQPTLSPTQAQHQRIVRVPGDDVDLPFKFLQGRFSGDGATYSFEEYDLGYLVQKDRPGRQPLLRRSLSGASVLALATRTPTADRGRSGPAPTTDPPMRPRRGPFFSNSPQSHQSTGPVRPLNDIPPANQVSARPRHTGSRSSSSAAFSYYGSELLPSQNTSREPSSVDDQGGFGHGEFIGQPPRGPFPQHPRGSSHSYPNLAPSGQSAFSPLPSNPYMRGQAVHGFRQPSNASSIGRGTMDGQVDAATAVAQDRNSPLEGYANQYHNLAHPRPSRQTMPVLPHSSQPHTGNLRDIGPRPSGIVLQPYQNPYQNPYQSPYQSAYPPYPASYQNPYPSYLEFAQMQPSPHHYGQDMWQNHHPGVPQQPQQQQFGSPLQQQQQQRQHHERSQRQQHQHSNSNYLQQSSQHSSASSRSPFRAQAHRPRANQRSSENVPVDPASLQARTMQNGQVQNQAAVYERLHNAAQAPQPLNPRYLERGPSRPNAPHPTLPRDISNRPRTHPAHQPSTWTSNRSSTTETPASPPPTSEPRQASQNEPSMRGGAPATPPYPSRRHSADRTLRAHPHPHREPPAITSPPLRLRPARSPLTALALDHGTAARPPRSPLVRAGAPVRTQRRVPARQRNQENSGDVEMAAMRREEAAILARYSEEERGEVMDETPPPVGRVERRMFE